MISSWLMMATTIGGFTYHDVTLSDRTRQVGEAPNKDLTWKEHVKAVKAVSSKDVAFSRYMRKQAVRLQKEYYGGGAVDERASFASYSDGGWLDVSQSVVAGSPDVVCVSMEASSYGTGAAHPNLESAQTVNWSRKLNRPLQQGDVFAVQPDRALRLLAAAKFSNRSTDSGLADGLPLDWNSACIGPKGITWSYGPYSFGGYLSGGDTTISWTALKPYLRSRLPFVVSTIRAASSK